MKNDLIAGLPRADGRLLIAACEQVSLTVSERLGNRGEVSEFLYFPSAGAVSILGEAQGHAAVASAMVGSEGAVGVHLVLGILQAPVSAVVTCPGTAWRISRAALGGVLDHSKVLRQRLHQYAVMQFDQIGRAGACLCFHQIPERLARWLLMCHDRAHGQSFHATHEHLALMLGVRRVSVTVAAVAMQRQGLIDYHRGEFSVVDPTALTKLSCACYREDIDARKVFKLRR